MVIIRELSVHQDVSARHDVVLVSKNIVCRLLEAPSPQTPAYRISHLQWRTPTREEVLLCRTTMVSCRHGRGVLNESIRKEVGG
jgi:hypothetical protein